MKLPYTTYGSGLDVILLHAFPLSSIMWEPNIKTLLNIGCRVITPDLRGFGKNNYSAEKHSLGDLARDIADLLDFLEIEKAIIGGLSMGGYVLFNFYKIYPERVSALILCDTTFAADTDEKRTSRFKLIEQIKKNGSQALVENVLPDLISYDTKINNKSLVDYLKKEFLKVNPGSAVAALHGMAERIDHTNVLNKINIPTLLIFGEDDRVTNLETAKIMNQKIKDSRLKIIRQAGHYSNLENPEAFNYAVSEFIREFEIKSC